MRVLFIAPLPPPITGQSIASKILLDELKGHYEVDVIDFSKGTLKQGLNSLERLIQVGMILKEIWVKKKKADLIYLNISQSFAGNIKDLLTFLIIFSKLSRTIIHLHGGGIGKLLYDRHRWLFMLNKLFLKRIGAVIVLGKTHISIFDNMVPSDRIHVVPNCVADDLFVDEKEIRGKYDILSQLRILFIGNLLPGKGHEELAEAVMSLGEDVKGRIRVDFAGEFESKRQGEMFLKKISGNDEMHYHGVVYGDAKRQMLAKAHIFCLPTYYAFYEGQPISILEAYAAGCVVLTTDHGGIKDIFKNGENGFYVDKRSSNSLKDKIENIIKIKDPKNLLEIGLRNNMIAKIKCHKNKYVASIISIMDGIK